MTFSSDAFVRDARNRFAGLLQAHGFKEHTISSKTTFTSLTYISDRFTSLTYISDRMYVSIVVDRRDGQVYVTIGRLTNGSVPPSVIFAPTSLGEVQEFDLEMAIWSATGVRGMFPELGIYESEDEASVRVAIDDVAAATERYADAVISGDPGAWLQVSELMLSRLHDQGSA